MQRQIIAIGGGGFSGQPPNLTLELYALAQARKPEPAVAFVPTASGDADSYIASFYSAFSGLPCRPSHLPLFQRTPDLRSYVLAQDVIYVGGGNTKSMLAVWRDWGLPELLQEAWAAGVILAGVSAGAICWFEQGLTDSYGGELRPLPCLGILPGSCCPHYNSEAARRPTYHQVLAEGKLPSGFAIDDNAAIHFVDKGVHRVISASRGATAYRLQVVDGAVREEALPVDYRAEG